MSAPAPPSYEDVIKASAPPGDPVTEYAPTQGSGQPPYPPPQQPPYPVPHQVPYPPPQQAPYPSAQQAPYSVPQPSYPPQPGIQSYGQSYPQQYPAPPPHQPLQPGYPTQPLIQPYSQAGPMPVQGQYPQTTHNTVTVVNTGGHTAHPLVHGQIITPNPQLMLLQQNIRRRRIVFAGIFIGFVVLIFFLWLVVF